MSAAARARAWLHGVQAAVCDVFDPWDAGTVVRATRYPSYFDFNLVRVERDPGMSVESMVAFADEALAEHGHRRIDFELADVAEPLRAGFATHGYASERLVWMRHETARPSAPDGIAVEEVPYDTVRPLRVGWFEEDFPEAQVGGHLAEAREVHLLLGARIFAVLDGREPVGYAQLERLGRSAEITAVYVRVDHRGRGLGTALTSAGIEAAETSTTSGSSRTTTAARRRSTNASDSARSGRWCSSCDRRGKEFERMDPFHVLDAPLDSSGASRGEELAPAALRAARVSGS